MNIKKVTSHRVFQNASALAVMQITNYIVPLLVLLHLTSVLGVELYGVVAFVTGIVLLGFVVMDFGYSLSAANKISLNREKNNYVGKLVFSIVIVKIALFFVVALIVLSYAGLSSKYSGHKDIISLALLPIFFQGLLPLWFFQGIERMKNIAIISVLSKLSFFVMVFVFVREEQDYWYVPLMNGIAQFLALCLSFFLFYRCGYNLKIPNRKYLRYALEINRGFFLSRVAVASYMQSAPVLIGLVLTPAAVGFYSLAEQLYRVMQSAIMPVVQALYPYMSIEKNYKLYVKVSLLLIGFILMAVIVGYLLAPFLVGLVFGEEWLSIIHILNIFFFAIIVNVLSVLMGYPICSALGFLKVANQSVVFGALVYFVVFCFFYLFGLVSPVSMVFVMISAELYVLAHRVYFVLPRLMFEIKSVKE